MVNAYTTYYLNQSGGGLIGNIYKSPYLGIQRGRGLGSIFGGLLRFLKPIFKSGLSAVKDQAIKTGINVLQDIGTTSKPIKNILYDRGLEARDNLKDKAMRKIKNTIKGKGINSGKPKKKIIRQSDFKKDGSFQKNNILRKIISKASKTKKNSNKKKKNIKERTLDIFT